MVEVKVHKRTENAMIPARMTDGSAGFDLCVSEDAIIRNVNVDEKQALVHTGISLEIPEGYHGKIFLRSSTGLKTKLRLANGTGIIDSDYRGEIMLIVETNARQYQTIHKGDRLAQILIEKNEDVKFVEVSDEDDTKEAPKTTKHKGFGSTGRKAK